MRAGARRWGEEVEAGERGGLEGIKGEGWARRGGGTGRSFDRCADTVDRCIESVVTQNGWKRLRLSME